jgi:N4-gp56 family major capsid protein
MAAFLPNYWDRVLGDNLRPNLYMYDLGEIRKLPANFGTTIKIPRTRKGGTTAARDVIWQVSNTAEGTATATCGLSAELVSGTLQKFRGAYKHSDVIVMTALSDVIQLSVEDISFDLARKMDTHIRVATSAAGLVMGTNGETAFAGPATRAKLSTVFATDLWKPTDLVRAEVILESRDNPRYPGTNKYALVIHPRHKYDIITSTSTTFAGWVDVNKYNNAEKIFNGEIGSLYGFKVISSTNMKVSSGMLSQQLAAATSYAVALALAPRAYYVTELSEMSARTYVKQLGSAGAADPTNDFCTVGAKVYFTAISGGSAFSKSAGEYRQIRIYGPTRAVVSL